MPFVMVIGAVGYFIEQKISNPKKIPYLDESVKDGREERQMEVELDSHYGAPSNIEEIKSKIVPKSSLLLNTGRKGLIDNESRRQGIADAGLLGIDFIKFDVLLFKFDVLNPGQVL